MTPERWAQLKDILYNKERDLPLLYMPLEHPDFADWQVVQPCVERWAMMQRHIPVTGKMLDLGCNTGWFCRQFNKAGYWVVGIDKDPIAIEVARELRQWQGDAPLVYRNENIFDIELPYVDVVLCLSILMYMFEDVTRGWEFLNTVSERCDVMFADFGGMYSDRLPFTKETFSAEILSRTRFKRCTLLGVSNLEQRPFYLLSK